MTILITGGTGLIGTTLAEQLLSGGERVVLFDVGLPEARVAALPPSRRATPARAGRRAGARRDDLRDPGFGRRGHRAPGVRPRRRRQCRARAGLAGQCDGHRQCARGGAARRRPARHPRQLHRGLRLRRPVFGRRAAARRGRGAPRVPDPPDLRRRQALHRAPGPRLRADVRARHRGAAPERGVRTRARQRRQRLSERGDRKARPGRAGGGRLRGRGHQLRPRRRCRQPVRRTFAVRCRRLRAPPLLQYRRRHGHGARAGGGRRARRSRRARHRHVERRAGPGRPRDPRVRRRARGRWATSAG